MRVVFTGDIAFSGYFLNSWGSQAFIEPEIIRFLKSADYVVGNVESPLSTSVANTGRKLNHISNPRCGSLLKELNISVWSIANNHIMDAGKKGLKDTLDAAQRYNCQTVGADDSISSALTPLILEKEKVRIGVISATMPWDFLKATEQTPGALTIDRKNEIRTIIEGLRKTVHWIILVVHNGDEYCDIASPAIKEQYRKLADLGVDIIVGHHPHVVQNYEKYNNSMIFYSLGNFVFDTVNQRKYPHTDYGVLLGLEFSTDGYTFDYLPTRVNRENNQIEVSEKLPVFDQIPDCYYKTVWSAAAEKYYPLGLRNRVNNKKKLRDKPRAFIALYEFLRCYKKEARVVQIGRLRSVLFKTDVADPNVKAIITYIRES